jgi:hypothetical protein
MHKKNNKFIKKEMIFTALEIQGKSEKRIGSLTLDFHSLADTGKFIEFQEFSLKEGKELGKLCISLKLFMQSDSSKKTAARSDSLGNVRRAFSVDEAEGIKVRDEMESLDDGLHVEKNLVRKAPQEKKVDTRRGSVRALRKGFVETKNDIEKDLDEFLEEEKEEWKESQRKIERQGGQWNFEQIKLSEGKIEMLSENSFKGLEKGVSGSSEDGSQEFERNDERIIFDDIQQVGESFIASKILDLLEPEIVTYFLLEKPVLQIKTIYLEKLETSEMKPLRKSVLDIKTIHRGKPETSVMKAVSWPVLDIKTYHRGKPETFVIKAVSFPVLDIKTFQRGKPKTSVMKAARRPVVDIKIFQRGKPKTSVIKAARRPVVDIKTFQRGKPQTFIFSADRNIKLNILTIHRGKPNILKYLPVRHPTLDIKTIRKKIKKFNSLARPIVNIESIHNPIEASKAIIKSSLNNNFQEDILIDVINTKKETFSNFPKISESSSSSDSGSSKISKKKKNLSKSNSSDISIDSIEEISTQKPIQHPIPKPPKEPSDLPDSNEETDHFQHPTKQNFESLHVSSIITTSTLTHPTEDLRKPSDLPKKSSRSSSESEKNSRNPEEDSKGDPSSNLTSKSETSDVNVFEREFLVSSSSESSEDKEEVLNSEEISGPLTDMKETTPNSASQEARLDLKEKESGLPQSRNTTCCGKCSIF